MVGLFIGWRGRTYSLPVLIDASFWNRRVAAHRMVSMGLVEVLQQTLRAANEHPDSKSFLLGHSMGGLILERTIGHVVLGEILAVEKTDVSRPIGYDLIVSPNPSTEALHTRQLIDVFKRTRVRLVLEDGAGHRRPADGPMMVSVTSENDGVTKWMVPLAMRINSIFVRYRRDGDPTMPSQKTLGLHTAGHLPFLFSHTAEVQGDDVVLTEIPGRWNDTPLGLPGPGGGQRKPRRHLGSALASAHAGVDEPQQGLRPRAPACRRRTGRLKAPRRASETLRARPGPLSIAMTSHPLRRCGSIRAGVRMDG